MGILNCADIYLATFMTINPFVDYSETRLMMMEYNKWIKYASQVWSNAQLQINYALKIADVN